MIKSDRYIKDWILGGGVRPACMKCVNPASLDLRIGEEYICSSGKYLMGPPGLILTSGFAILATTVEYIKMPDDIVGMVCLKSSLARQGLDHSLAGFVDPGFEGQLTLELHAHRAVKLKAGQRIAQLVLYQMDKKPTKTYDGRYQGQRGPTAYREAK